MAAKLGNDWVFIGLGIGALYLIYKLGKPVQDIGTGIADAVDPWLENIQKVGELPKIIGEKLAQRNEYPITAAQYVDSEQTRTALQAATIVSNISGGRNRSAQLDYALGNKSALLPVAPAPRTTVDTSRSVVFKAGAPSYETGAVIARALQSQPTARTAVQNVMNPLSRLRA